MSALDRDRLEQMLAGLARSGGTSLHVSAGNRPWIRLGGSAVATDDPPVDGEELRSLAGELLFADQITRAERGEEVEVVWSSANAGRFRVSALSHADGLGLVFRLLPERAPSFEECELPEVLAAFTMMRSGLVLITGPFGSGKSTTMAGIVARIETERAVNVVTIERRIDLVHGSGRTLIHQREVGTHVESVASAVRDAFLQGADAIAVGEIGSAADLLAVIEAAESGLLVLATFEASGIAGAIADLPRLCPPGERASIRDRLAAVTSAVVGQTLIRRRHGRGRVPLLEILFQNERVERAIRRGKVELLERIMDEGAGVGMQTVDLGIRRLLQRHAISEDEALQHAAGRLLERGTLRVD